jgi:hypothetical protein
MKNKFMMASTTENLPSGNEKQVHDGKHGRKFTIRKRNASLRWHGQPIIYHPEKKSEFTMVIWPENLPSGNEKQVHDGTSG